MSNQIKKSGTGIEEQGNAIHRSGTGIHRSGTGIRKGGTGLRLPSLAAGLFVASTALCTQAIASEPDLLVSERNDNLLISLHSDEGVYTGAVPMAAGDGGYFQVGLHQIAVASESGMVFDPLVKGTGSGDAGESAGSESGLLVKGTRSGAAGESAGAGDDLLVKGTGSGSAGEGICGNAGVLVKGTGSGNAGERADGESGLLVKGTGSGNAGESAGGGSDLLVKGTGSGNSGDSVGGGDFGVLVKGTGSGNAGESNGGCGAGGFDLLAEVVIDADGAHVLIHDRQGNEQLVGFVAAAHNNAPDDRRGTTRGFVATP